MVKNEDGKYNDVKVLILDQNKNIAGIANIEEEFVISPKVVFNAIG